MRSRRATRLGRYPRSSKACSTTARVSATTLTDLFMTRETVAIETLARSATCWRLAMGRTDSERGRGGRRFCRPGCQGGSSAACKRSHPRKRGCSSLTGTDETLLREASRCTGRGGLQFPPRDVRPGIVVKHLPVAHRDEESVGEIGPE